MVILLAESVKEAQPGELVLWKMCGTCDAQSKHVEVSEGDAQLRFKVARAAANSV